MDSNLEIDMSVITEATFDDRLNSAVASDNSLATTIQQLLEYSHAHYKEHDCPSYYAKIMNAGFRASRKEGMRKYIVDHTNLRCVKDPADESKLTFTKNPKSKIKRIKAFPKNEDGSTVTWFEYSGEKINIDFDLEARIKSLIKSFVSASEDAAKKVKGTKAHNKELIDGLKSLVVVEV